MRRLLTLAVLLSISILIGGCGKRSLSGIYRDPTSKAVFTFQPDGYWSGSAPGSDNTASGTYEVNGNKISLRARLVRGQAPHGDDAQTKEATLSDDGGTIDIPGGFKLVRDPASGGSTAGRSALEGAAVVVGAVCVCGLGYLVVAGPLAPGRRRRRGMNGGPLPAGGAETIPPVAIADDEERETITPQRANGGRGRGGSPAPVAPPAGQLEARSGPLRGQQFALAEGENRIGRGSACEIRITGDEEISREHAMVRIKGGECYLCDLASRNGTYLNGARVERDRRLHQGDVVRVGGTELTFISAP